MHLAVAETHANVRGGMSLPPDLDEFSILMLFIRAVQASVADIKAQMDKIKASSGSYIFGFRSLSLRVVRLTLIYACLS